jgi:hypothetical protein
MLKMGGVIAEIGVASASSLFAEATVFLSYFGKRSISRAAPFENWD